MKNYSRTPASARRTWLIILVIVAIASLVWVYWGCPRFCSDIRNSGNEVVKVIPNNSTKDVPWQYTKHNKNEETNKYTISSNYELVAVVTSSGEKIDNQIENKLSEIMGQFKKDAADFLPYIEESEKSSLNIKASFKEPAGDYLTYLIEVIEYQSGAAHPNGYTESLTFSRQTGQEISLADLFKFNTDYYARLTDLGKIALLSKNFGPESVQNSSTGSSQSPNSSPSTNDAPDESQIVSSFFDQSAKDPESLFSTFSVLSGGLDFIFDPYQVGPGAMGSSEILIDWKDLDDVLRSGINLGRS